MSTSTVLSRLSALRYKVKSNSNATNLLKSSSHSQHPATVTRIIRQSRLPAEMSCLLTMRPLYNAIASARLCSDLSIDSQSRSLIPQGISMPL